MFHIDEFLKHLKEKQYSYYTLQAYLKDLRRFEVYCSRFGVEDVRNISKQIVCEYTESLNGKDYPACVNR